MGFFIFQKFTFFFLRFFVLVILSNQIFENFAGFFLGFFGRYLENLISKNFVFWVLNSRCFFTFETFFWGLFFCVFFKENEETPPRLPLGGGGKNNFYLTCEQKYERFLF